MGENQLASTVDLLIEDFYYLKVEDLKLCFQNAKKGKYGKVYDRIDGNIIYGWVEQYSKDRIEQALKMNL